MTKRNVFITSGEARRQHKGLKTYWSSESYLSQKILISILEHLERLVGSRLTKSLRKPTEYQKFFGDKIKEGLTAKEIGALWKKRNRSDVVWG